MLGCNSMNNPPDSSSDLQTQAGSSSSTPYTSSLSFASCLQILIHEIEDYREILLTLLQALCALPSFRNIVFDQNLVSLGLTDDEIKFLQDYSEPVPKNNPKPKSAIREDPMSLADRLLDQADASHKKTRVREALGELFRLRTEILIVRAKSLMPSITRINTLTPQTGGTTSPKSPTKSLSPHSLNSPKSPIESTDVTERIASSDPIPIQPVSTQAPISPPPVPPRLPKRTPSTTSTTITVSSPSFSTGSLNQRSTSFSTTINSTPQLPLMSRSANFKKSIKNQSSLSQEYDESDDVLDEKTESLISRGVTLFNSKPSKGIEFLQENGILGDQPSAIAHFLSNHPDISPVKLGDYLGEPELQSVLHAFTEEMDFSGLDLDFALRRFLAKFRLPGEAQKIDRMMETFAQRFYSQNSSGVFANADAAYVLAFSLIMLNTDAHNPSIKKQDKMTKQQFIQNNRGINNGKNIDQNYLELLYDHIVRDQIQLPDGLTLFSNAEKKGWLVKQGGKIKTWKKRWFVLSRNCLFYFKTEADPEPCGIVPLENLVVSRYYSKKDRERENSQSHSNKGRRWKFRIGPSVEGEEVKSCKMQDGVVVKGNHSEYIICASSEEEMDDWMQSLEEHMHKHPFFDLLEQKKAALRVKPNNPRGLSSTPSQFFSTTSLSSSSSLSYPNTPITGSPSSSPGSRIQHARSPLNALSRSTSFNSILPSNTLSSSSSLGSTPSSFFLSETSMTSPRKQLLQNLGEKKEKDPREKERTAAILSPKTLRRKIEDKWKKKMSPASSSLSSLDLQRRGSEADIYLGSDSLDTNPRSES